MGKPYEVFVLVDSVDYEGESILGVYSTMENAKKAADRWVGEDKGFWDQIYVYTISVDALPEAHCFNLTEKVK